MEKLKPKKKNSFPYLNAKKNFLSMEKNKTEKGSLNNNKQFEHFNFA